MRRLVYLAVLLAGPLIGSTRAGGETTYDAVTVGIKCYLGRTCEYRVGRSLYFTIEGVGTADVLIIFHSASEEGDYYAEVWASGGAFWTSRSSLDCVIVRAGDALGRERYLDKAFVSPRDGKVYRTQEDCHAAVGVK